MLLEVAERFALQKEKPRRTIVFVAFDQEETGLIGSRHFASHPPRDLKKLKAFMTADMLGRSMANLMDEYVFALGSESSPRLRKLVEEVPTEKGLKVGRVGADLIGTRSDYGPFAIGASRSCSSAPASTPTTTARATCPTGSTTSSWGASRAGSPS